MGTIADRLKLALQDLQRIDAESQARTDELLADLRALQADLEAWIDDEE